MKSARMTMTEERDIAFKWAETIEKEYVPDLVVFIAKSGFIIAEEIARYFGVPLDEVCAHRAGGKLRKVVAPVFRVIPLRIRNWMVSLLLGFNSSHEERNVEIPKSLISKANSGKYSRVLLVDDSIDTGWTFLKVYDELNELFRGKTIRTAAMICLYQSLKRFQVDYFLYEDILILTPAQIDSNEHMVFLEQYETWKLEKDEHKA